MELTQENLEAIGSYVRGRLPEWLREVGPVEVVRTDPQLIERMVRVEEELKSQRELMKQGFEQVDRRFEQVDKRFEEQRGDMNARFAEVDKRFEDMHRHSNRWMTVLTIVVSLFGTAATLAGILG